MTVFLLLGEYDVDGGLSENTYGWKSVGQELRINDVTSDITTFQHGNRALATKDMRKSQGMFTSQYSYFACSLINLFTSITFSVMFQTDRWLTLRSLVWPIFCGEHHGKMTENADWPL